MRNFIFQVQRLHRSDQRAVLLNSRLIVNFLNMTEVFKISGGELQVAKDP